MDGFNFTTVGSILVAIMAILLNYTGRQKYKDNASFFESSNHELREQNATLRQDKADMAVALTKAQTESAQKDTTIEQLKPFSEVVTTMSNNHKAVMLALGKVTELITGKVDGHK